LKLDEALAFLQEAYATLLNKEDFEMDDEAKTNLYAAV
jgi:hypothetical protein